MNPKNSASRIEICFFLRGHPSVLIFPKNPGETVIFHPLFRGIFELVLCSKTRSSRPQVHNLAQRLRLSHFGVAFFRMSHGSFSVRGGQGWKEPVTGFLGSGRRGHNDSNHPAGTLFGPNHLIEWRRVRGLSARFPPTCPVIVAGRRNHDFRLCTTREGVRVVLKQVNCIVRRIVCTSNKPRKRAMIPQRCRLFRRPWSQNQASQAMPRMARSA
jgi:hypothetical protein